MNVYDYKYKLCHGGPGSGRYPLGSGERPYQHEEYPVAIQNQINKLENNGYKIEELDPETGEATILKCDKSTYNVPFRVYTDKQKDINYKKINRAATTVFMPSNLLNAHKDCIKYLSKKDYIIKEWDIDLDNLKISEIYMPSGPDLSNVSIELHNRTNDDYGDSWIDLEYNYKRRKCVGWGIEA